MTILVSLKQNKALNPKDCCSILEKSFLSGSVPWQLQTGELSADTRSFVHHTLQQTLAVV